MSSTENLTGDFDGDGRIDFLQHDKMYLKLFQGNAVTIQIPFSRKERTTFTGATLLNNKLYQGNTLIKVNENQENVVFETHNLNATHTALVPNNTKTVPLDNKGYCYDYCSFDNNPNYFSYCDSPTFTKYSNKYLEGDFNGDGLSEVLVLGYTEQYMHSWVENQPQTNSTNNTNQQNAALPPPDGNCVLEYYKSTHPTMVHLIDLNPNAPTELNSKGNVKLSSTDLQYFANYDKEYIADFNGDGKADVLLVANNGDYKLITFKQLLVVPWMQVELIGYGNIDEYSSTKVMLFGDFNGDGKTDFTLPDTEGGNYHYYWHIYYSNPKPNNTNVFEKNSYNIVEYLPVENISPTNVSISLYYALDVNKDGKTDILRLIMGKYKPNTWAYRDRDTYWHIHTYINNIGNINNNIITEITDPETGEVTTSNSLGDFKHEYSSPWDHDSDDNSFPIPMPIPIKYNGLSNDFVVVRYHGEGSFEKKIHYISFTKDVSRDALLTKVTQSAGAVVDQITYSPMEPSTANNGLGALSDFYSSSNAVSYPYIDLRQLPQNKLVSKLTNTAMGITKHQDFKYHGYTVHLGGLGAIGFQKTARSSWYRTVRRVEIDKKLWNVIENDALYRGATVRSYTKLLPQSTAFAFETTPTGWLSKSENQFTQSTNPTNKLYTVLLQKQTSTDALTNVVVEKEYTEYTPTYNLPRTVVSRNYVGTTLQGTTTSVTNFENNPTGVGATYYVGRPTEEITTVSAYEDTKTSNTKYFYTTQGNIQRTEKKPNNAPETLIETFEYFTNGLLKKKTISATGTTSSNAVSPRTTEYTYDPTNRFIKTTKDTEGLITTNVSYHPVYGLPLQVSNPYGLTTTNVYDNWGKRTKVTDFLGKSITYTYTKTGGVYTTTETADDGSISKVESDALAREIRRGSTDINGLWNYITKEYDHLGRNYRTSEPYTAGSNPTQWNTTEYDDYSRPIKVTQHTGKVTTLSYNGLTGTSTDGVFTKTTTKNANGHTTTTTDTPGGTITYSYYADGNLKESNYDGIILSMQYDAWGRKIQLNDPSAGLYSYTYNAYGETRTETTPKGITTYTLDANGKLQKKQVVGNTAAEQTNITSTYVYDPTTKLLNSIAVTNPNDGNNSYSYLYDSYKRVYKTTETTPQATFVKQLTFDAFGRVDTETSTATAHGKSSSMITRNTYKNGEHWQTLDNSTNQVLWETKTTNARGQLLTATMGNGINILNQYDAFGLPKQQSHTKNGADVMTLDYSFDAPRGNLKNRTNSLFAYTESFQYDNLDRLTNIYRPGSVLVNATFNSTTEGFVYTGGAGGSQILENGRLKVTVPVGSFDTMIGGGTKKLIYQSQNITKHVKITADIKKTSGGPAYTIVPLLRITLPNSPSDVVDEIILNSINTGLEAYQYTLPANRDVYLCYEVFPNGLIENPIDTNPIDIQLQSTSLQTQAAALPPNGGTTNVVFTLDNLTIQALEEQIQTYDDRGRITENSNGTYEYTDATKPYQNTAVTLKPNQNSYYQANSPLNITYNAFKSPIEIIHPTADRISFGYNYLQQRSVMYYGNTNANKLARPYRRYYSADGTMEITYTTATGAVEFMTYIGGDPYTAPMVQQTKFATPATTTPTKAIFYLHRDYQGSILAVSNSAGALVEKRLFDAWGEIVLVKDGAGNILPKLTFFDRGYTGHEHLQGVGLIHMNGRLYDAKLHRFLQPDNYVQDPYNTQNYNRYGYVLNNPLKYTDPSGELFGLDDLAAAVIIAAVVSALTYTASNYFSDQAITFKGFASAVIVGAISGAVTFGIGEWASSIGNFYVRAGAQALMHGTFQGGMTAVQGGKFWTGFASGALSSLVSSAWQGGESFRKIGDLKIKFTDAVHKGVGGALGISNRAISTMLLGTITGGAGAAMTKGNFWQGAVTGLIVSGLNHVAHSAFDGDGDPPVKGKTYIREFSKSKTDYLFAEGVGLAGSFSIDGTVIVNINNNSMSIRVGASGKTLANMAGGTVQFGGSVELVVNNKVIDTKPFKIPSSGIYYESNTFPMGSTEFNIPFNIKNNVIINIRANYIYDNSGQRAASSRLLNQIKIQ